MPVVEMIPAGRRESERVRGVVEVAPRAPALGADRALLGVHADPLHVRQVDHDPAVADRVAGHVVAPAPDRDRQPLLAGEVHRSDHVGDVGAARDQRAGRLSIIPFQTLRASS